MMGSPVAGRRTGPISQKCWIEERACFQVDACPSSCPSFIVSPVLNQASIHRAFGSGPQNDATPPSTDDPGRAFPHLDFGDGNPLGSHCSENNADAVQLSQRATRMIRSTGFPDVSLSGHPHALLIPLMTKCRNDKRYIVQGRQHTSVKPPPPSKWGSC